MTNVHHFTTSRFQFLAPTTITMQSAIFILAITLSLCASAIVPFAPSAPTGAAHSVIENADILGHLSYLGEANAKHFYIVRNYVTRENAAANCAVVGLELARVESKEDLAFIHKTTTYATDRAWVGAEFSSSYRKSDGTPLDRSLVYAPVNGKVEGLIIGYYTTSAILVQKPVTNEYYYLCSVAA